MKAPKLNARGVAHEFLIVGVLVIFSIVGIGYMVAGNANPSNGKAASADGIQGGGVHGPARGTTVSCSIDSLPETGTYKQALKPYLRIKNEGPKIYTGTVDYGLSAFGADGKQVEKYSKRTGKEIRIKVGATVKYPLPKYTVHYSGTRNITRLHYSANLQGLGWCNNMWVGMPQKPTKPQTTKPAPKKTTPAPKPVNTGGGGSVTGGGEG